MAAEPTEDSRLTQAHIIKTQLPNPLPKPEDLLEQVHLALEEMKAKDAVEIDVRGKTSITDFMVIATGSSSRHVKSLAENVLEKVKEQGVRPLGNEGLDGGEWALLDLGDVVVHVMQEATREFYDLERLWQGAEQSRAQHQE